MFSKKENVDLDNSYTTLLSDKIFEAVQKNQEDMLRGFFHDQSLRIWAIRDERGFTILHRAVFNNNESMVTLIVEEMKKRVGMNSKKAIEKFINDKNQEGITAMHYAAYRGNISIAKILYEYGAVLDLVTGRGKNVMHMAAEGNQPSIMVYFINYHAQDVFCVDDCGSTPLHWACYSGGEETVDLLIALHADINAIDKEGLTPLHLAVESNRIKVVLKLLQHGADKSIANKKGDTPLAIAEKKNYTKIEDLLRQEDFNPLCTLELPTEKIEINNYYKKAIYPVIILPELIIFFFVLPFIPGNVQFFINISVFILCLLSYIGIYIKSPIYAIDKELEALPASENRLKVLVDRQMDLTRYCPTCHIMKTPTLKHCIICNKCVDGFDHHSFWLSKCIGTGNSGFYLTSLIFALLYSLHSMFISIVCFYNDFSMPEDKTFPPNWLVPTFDRELITILLGFIFLLGFFISCPLVCLIFIYIFKKCECYYPPQEFDIESDRETKIKGRSTVTQELFSFRTSSIASEDPQKKNKKDDEHLVDETNNEEGDDLIPEENNQEHEEQNDIMVDDSRQENEEEGEPKEQEQKEQTDEEKEEEKEEGQHEDSNLVINDENAINDVLEEPLIDNK